MPCCRFLSLAASLLALFCSSVAAQTSGLLIPGTGTKIATVGDDFEDANWGYRFNAPKSSQEQDENTRNPTGSATNGRWYEGALRGQPDVIQRIDTPPGGLEGSLGSLLIRSRDTGIPRRPSGKMQQDDLIINVKQRIGGLIPVSWQPSVVTRVYVPPFDQWEPRTGNSFGFRAGCWGPYKGEDRKEYWPGMFIYLHSTSDRRTKTDSAVILVRGDQMGRDFRGPEITEPGWWTLGMSFTPDGRIHYFASPGVDDLTAEDHIASHHAYGIRCQQFDTFFFNVCSADNGRTWSTPWVIDDPTLYALRVPQTTARRGR
jgi:hypothetical protein